MMMMMMITLSCLSECVCPHLVEHAVEESGYDGEHGGFESLQIVHQRTDVTLKVTDPRSVHQDHTLHTN